MTSPGEIAILRMLLANDPLRRQALETVAELKLPDGWIGAGFVRDAVWDHLHGKDRCPPVGDVDVIWFDDLAPQEEIDRAAETRLSRRFPGLQWSVKNQARMHHRNGNSPYRSVADAMRHWPETATAISARIGDDGSIEINAPFGTGDLFALRLLPTADFVTRKRDVFDGRVTAKRWIERYPRLVLPDVSAAPGDGL